MKKTFEQWMKDVDAALIAKIGLTHEDLTDQTWADWYENGKTAKGAANQAIRNESGEGE
jgi:hypothetical protein